MERIRRGVFNDKTRVARPLYIARPFRQHISRPSIHPLNRLVARVSTSLTRGTRGKVPRLPFVPAYRIATKRETLLERLLHFSRNPSAYDRVPRINAP